MISGMQLQQTGIITQTQKGENANMQSDHLQALASQHNNGQILINCHNNSDNYQESLLNKFHQEMTQIDQSKLLNSGKEQNLNQPQLDNYQSLSSFQQLIQNQLHLQNLKSVDPNNIQSLTGIQVRDQVQSGIYLKDASTRQNQKTQSFVSLNCENKADLNQQHFIQGQTQLPSTVQEYEKIHVPMSANHGNSVITSATSMIKNVQNLQNSAELKKFDQTNVLQEMMKSLSQLHEMRVKNSAEPQQEGSQEDASQKNGSGYSKSRQMSLTVQNIISKQHMMDLVTQNQNNGKEMYQQELANQQKLMISGNFTEQEQNQKSTVDQTQMSYSVPMQSVAQKNSTEIIKASTTQQKNDQLKISLNFSNNVIKGDSKFSVRQSQNQIKNHEMNDQSHQEMKQETHFSGNIQQQVQMIQQMMGRASQMPIQQFQNQNRIVQQSVPQVQQQQIAPQNMSNFDLQQIMQMMNGGKVDFAEPQPKAPEPEIINDPNLQFGDQIGLLNQMIGLITTIQSVQKDTVSQQLAELNQKVTADCGFLFRDQQKITFLQSVIESVEQQNNQNSTFHQHEQKIETQIQDQNQQYNQLMQMQQRQRNSNEGEPQSNSNQYVGQLEKSLELLSQLQHHQQQMISKHNLNVPQGESLKQIVTQPVQQQPSPVFQTTAGGEQMNLEHLKVQLNLNNNNNQNELMAAPEESVMVPEMTGQASPKQSSRQMTSKQSQHEKSFDMNSSQKNGFNLQSLCIQKNKNLFQNGEIIDKGDYQIIHRYNRETKRMNQILQCKHCPLRFPKLCNMFDHIRIHQDSMPFECKYCHKSFTQKGNRDRHQSKFVCMKRDSFVNVENWAKENESSGNPID